MRRGWVPTARIAGLCLTLLMAAGIPAGADQAVLLSIASPGRAGNRAHHERSACDRRDHPGHRHALDRGPADLRRRHGRQVMAALKARGVTDAAKGVAAIANNDYQVGHSDGGLRSADTLIAYARDGAAMPVRDKGPLWVVFPSTAIRTSSAHHLQGLCDLGAGPPRASARMTIVVLDGMARPRAPRTLGPRLRGPGIRAARGRLDLLLRSACSAPSRGCATSGDRRSHHVQPDRLRIRPRHSDSVAGDRRVPADRARHGAAADRHSLQPASRSSAPGPRRRVSSTGLPEYKRFVTALDQALATADGILAQEHGPNLSRAGGTAPALGARHLAAVARRPRSARSSSPAPPSATSCKATSSRCAG